MVYPKQHITAYIELYLGFPAHATAVIVSIRDCGLAGFRALAYCSGQPLYCQGKSNPKLMLSRLVGSKTTGQSNYHHFNVQRIFSRCMVYVVQSRIAESASFSKLSHYSSAESSFVPVLHLTITPHRRLNPLSMLRSKTPFSVDENGHLFSFCLSCMRN